MTKAVISFLAIEKVGFSYVYLTLSFLAMDVCASVHSPASLQSFFEVLFWRRRYSRWRSRLSLDRHHLQLCDGRTRVCLQVNACLVRELVWKFSFLEVLFRCRRCKWWRSRLSSALSCTSSSRHCLSLRWTCVPPYIRQPPCKAFFEVLFWRRRYKRWRSRLSLDKDRHHLHSFALDVCASSQSPALWESFLKVLFRRRRFKKAAFTSFLGLKLRIFFRTFSFLAMDMSASGITPALWESACLHGSSLSTKALSKVAFTSFLQLMDSTSLAACTFLGWTCVPPALRQPRVKDS